MTLTTPGPGLGPGKPFGSQGRSHRRRALETLDAIKGGDHPDRRSSTCCAISLAAPLMVVSFVFDSARSIDRGSNLRDVRRYREGVDFVVAVPEIFETRQHHNESNRQFQELIDGSNEWAALQRPSANSPDLFANAPTVRPSTRQRSHPDRRGQPQGRR